VFLFECGLIVVQPTPTVLAHFQGRVNCVTTPHPVNTHGYRNHVCLDGELWLHVRCQIYANMHPWPIPVYFCRIVHGFNSEF